VVDLVLEELGTIAFHFYLGPLSLQILIAQLDPVGTRHPDQQVGKRKTVIPNLEVFIADIDDLWVDQGPGLVHLHIDHAHGRANLGGRNRPPAPEPGLPVAERLSHIVQDHSHGCGARLGDWLAPGAEDRIAQESYTVYSHSGCHLRYEWRPLAEPNMRNEVPAGQRRYVVV
jgi:hypothetical protein